MAKYIEIEAALQSACKGCNIEFDDQSCEPCDCYIREKLLAVPTIDAVPVVRCRECKHWKPSGSKAGNSFSDMEYIGGCEFTNYYRSESDFCSHGERKEGAEDA